MAAIYKKILSYIEEHIKDEITLEDLAKFMGYSSAHIYKIFKNYNSVPVMEYIRRKKLNYAADELYSGRKLYDIALDCGYETPAGFYKAFHNVFGCSPSAYKNNVLRRDLFMSKEMKEQTAETEKNIEEYTKQIAHDYINRGNCYANLKEYEKALEDYNKAIELEPNNAYYYYCRGISYDWLGNEEKSIENYKKAYELEPNNVTYLDCFAMTSKEIVISIGYSAVDLVHDENFSKKISKKFKNIRATAKNTITGENVYIPPATIMDNIHFKPYEIKLEINGKYIFEKEPEKDNFEESFFEAIELIGAFYEKK